MAELQAAFFHGKVQSLSAEVKGSHVDFQPFTVRVLSHLHCDIHSIFCTQREAPVQVRNLCSLYAHALFSMRPQVRHSARRVPSICTKPLNQVFDDPHAVQQLCETLLHLLPKSGREYRLDSLCKLLSSLLNKKADGKLPVSSSLICSLTVSQSQTRLSQLLWFPSGQVTLQIRRPCWRRERFPSQRGHGSVLASFNSSLLLG